MYSHRSSNVTDTQPIWWIVNQHGNNCSWAMVMSELDLHQHDIINWADLYEPTNNLKRPGATAQSWYGCKDLLIRMDQHYYW